MRERDQLLRRLIFLLGGLETVAVTVVIGIVMAGEQFSSGELLSHELAWVVMMIFGLPYFTCVIPALTFTFVNRYLSLAFGLCVLYPPATYVFFIYA